MKLSCHVTRDLLPLYHDGVCSDESRTLVEDHLRDCAECNAMLKELRGEIEVPHESPDDRAVLKKLGKNVKRAWIRGAAAVLAVVLAVFTGVNVWWYTGVYSFYTNFAEENGVWSDGIYEYTVQMPDYLQDNGQIQVMMDFERTTRSIELGRDVQAYLYISQDLPYSVHLTIIDHTKVSGQSHAEVTASGECVMLDTDMNQIYLDNWDEEIIVHQDQLLEDFGWEIMNIIEAAQAQWPFLTE